MPGAWTAHFEALRKGELSPQEWQAFSEGLRPRTQGLPPLEGRERQVMVEEYGGGIQPPSAINLLDLPAPSLPVLEADEEFEVRVRGATFTVFRNTVFP